MSTLFTKIVRGEVPAYKVAENSQFLAFLDINPNAKGHVLCIPKKEVDKLWDLEEDVYQELMRFVRAVSTALEKTVPCKRVGMAVVGLEVPHAHVHLIPLNNMKEMDFSNSVDMSKEEFEELAAAINANVEL
ncbi:HIT family protein [Christiangramia salexigens]|uniref:HIT family protein n=1 Tax=Christiangramia salexigens TaxID=1913577 RepID=A0A1L3J7A6_9FLAO|nr:HIT family protein [Christiangramia salexigens]APG60991.1 HIT family protein [Christiangramia salexigens]